MAVLVLLSITTILKAPKQDKYNYTNSDATWHTLLTIKAMQDTPISEHKLLPIVSLGDTEDKGIPWGGTVESNGNYYYTSFMPLSFIFPYFIFTILHLKISEINLFIISSVMSILCYMIFARILLNIFKKYLSELFILLIATVLYFFTTEMIHSTGEVYWGQSLWQLIFIIQLYLYYEIRQNYNTKNLVLFLLFTFLAPSSEWTGYISNLGFFIVTFADNIVFHKWNKVSFKNKNTVKLLASIVITTFIAGVSFFIHFLMVLRFDRLIATMINRFFARNIASSFDKTLFFIGYKNSYGSILKLLLVMLILILVNKSCRNKLKFILKKHICWGYYCFFLYLKI